MSKKRKRTKNQGKIPLLALFILFVFVPSLLKLLIGYIEIVFSLIIGFVLLYVYIRKQKIRRMEKRRQQLMQYNSDIQKKVISKMVSYVNKILRLEKHNLSKAEKERKRQLKKQYNKLYKQMGTSFVYIIQESSNGYIKIGKASDPMTRIVHGLGAKSPYPLNVIHLIPTNSSLEVEKWFHVAFVKQRINGEWFQLTTKQIDKIKSGDYSLELLEIITK